MLQQSKQTISQNRHTFFKKTKQNKNLKMHVAMTTQDLFQALELSALDWRTRGFRVNCTARWMICGHDLQATIQMTKQARIRCCTTHDGRREGEQGEQNYKHATLTPNLPLLVDTIGVHETEWVLEVGYSGATSKASLLLNSSLDGMKKRQKEKEKMV